MQRSQPRALPLRAHPRAVLRRRAAARGRGQGGFSLVEVLIALVLAGVVVLGLAAGLYTLIRTTRDTMERQQVEMALANFGEALKAAPYQPCDGPGGASVGAYQDAYDAWGVRWIPRPGMDARIVAVRYWDRATRSFTDACGAEDQGAQRFTLEVEWRGRDGRAQIVKRA